MPYRDDGTEPTAVMSLRDYSYASVCSVFQDGGGGGGITADDVLFDDSSNNSWSDDTISYAGGTTTSNSSETSSSYGGGGGTSGNSDGDGGDDDDDDTSTEDNKKPSVVAFQGSGGSGGGKWLKTLWTIIDRMDGDRENKPRKQRSAESRVKTILRPPITYKYVIGMSGCPSKVAVYPKRM